MVIFSHKATGRFRKPLSLKEAAVLASVTEKTIRHELAEKVIKPLRTERHRVFLGEKTVFFLFLVSHLPVELPRDERRDLFELLAHPDETRGNWAWRGKKLIRSGTVPVEVQTADAIREVTQRLNAFARGMERVDRSPETLGNEPVFRGTRISIQHVGALAKRGIPDTELLEDFPALSRDDITFARMFVDLGRPPGRPRKLKLIRQ